MLLSHLIPDWVFSCPRSKPLSSHLFYKADASEVKRCQLQAPHSTLSRSGMKGTRMQCALVSLPAKLDSDQFKCVLFLEKLKRLSSSLFVCFFFIFKPWCSDIIRVLNKILKQVIVRCTWSFSQSVSVSWLMLNDATWCADLNIDVTKKSLTHKCKADLCQVQMTPIL